MTVVGATAMLAAQLRAGVRDLTCQASNTGSNSLPNGANLSLTTPTPIDQHSAHPATVARCSAAIHRPPRVRGIQNAESAPVSLFDPSTPQAPAAAFASEFSDKQTGGHMARSMMLAELTALLAALPADATGADSRRAVFDESTLGKPTSSSRVKWSRQLPELYMPERGRGAPVRWRSA